MDKEKADYLPVIVEIPDGLDINNNAIEMLNDYYREFGEQRAAEIERDLKFYFRKPWWMPRFIFNRLFKLVVIREER